MLFYSDQIIIERQQFSHAVRSPFTVRPSVMTEKCSANKFTWMATVMKRNAAVRERYGPCLITRTKACWKETCFSVLGAYGSETRGIRISSISNNTQQGKADRFAHWNYWNCPCIAVDCACLRGVIYNKEQRMRANVITSMRRSPVYMFLHIPVTLSILLSISR